MAYLLNFFNTIENVIKLILSYSEEIKNIADVIALVFGGVIAIYGFNYIKTLKEKKASAIFGFWNHLSVKLIMLKNRLSVNYDIVNNMYSTETRLGWQNRGGPPPQKQLDEFLKIANETLGLIKSEVDQLPAYKGWTNDYLKTIEFLDDLFLFDVSDSTNYFKFNDKKIQVSDRDKYCKDVCDTIDRIIKGIKETQKETEQKLYKVSRKN